MHPTMTKVVRHKSLEGEEYLDIFFTDDDDSTTLLLYCMTPIQIYTKYSKRHERLTGLQVYNWHGGRQLNGLMDMRTDQFTLFLKNECPPNESFGVAYCGIQLAWNNDVVEGIRFNHASHTIFIQEAGMIDLIDTFQSIALS